MTESDVQVGQEIRLISKSMQLVVGGHHTQGRQHSLLPVVNKKATVEELETAD